MQAWMRAIVTDPRGASGALRERPFPREWIGESKALPAAARLSIYAEGYFHRLLDSLGGDYPAVRRVLGDGEFRRLIAEYLMSHPSTSPSLADAGEALPDFIAASFVHSPPFLAELAALERAVLRSALVDRGRAFDPAPLAEWAPERWADARVTLDGTITLLRTLHAVDLLREARGTTLTRECPRWLLVHRGAAGPSVVPLERLELEALDALRRGEPFGSVCSGLEKSGLDASAAAIWFAGWVRAGWVSEIAPGERQ
jgi:hypothetical protein